MKKTAKEPTVTVVQDETKPVDAKIIAQAIVDIDKGFKLSDTV